MTTIAQALAYGWQLQQTGALVEAEQCYRQVLAVSPQHANAWCYLGMVLHDQRRYGEAVDAYHHAIAANPQFPIAWSNLANTLSAAGRFEEAVAACRRATELKPDYARAYGNWGAILHKQRRFAEAEQRVRQAAALAPNDPLAWKNLGAILVECGRPDEAVQSLTQSLALAQSPEAYKDLGTARLRLGQPDAALADYQAALQLDANYAEAHYARSLVWLLQGDFHRGWEEYEWRWRRQGFAKPQVGAPEWDGGPLDGRTMLLVAEQGLGDTVQFVRYAQAFKERGSRVVVACPKPLEPILATCRSIDELATRERTLPPCDVYLPLLSAPRLLKTTLETVPASVPYLFADDSLRTRWQDQLANCPGYRIGIAWQGSRHNQADAQRSIPLAQFEPLARTAGVRLVSLQKGEGSEQVRSLNGRFEVIDWTDRLDEASGPFVDTAALMMSLDLVICCDTSIAHLAGALGVPVWIALPFAPDWRWLLDRADSPWYPTARLFRQPAPGAWPAVFEQMAKSLESAINR